MYNLRCMKIIFLPLLFCATLITAQQAPTFKMVQVKGGTFTMGSNIGEKNERPEHTVQLADFSICAYEVTQQQWMLVMKTNPSGSTICDSCPVEEVTPEQVDTFIERLNALSGRRYRLPTEAEWEYAARGGNQSKGYYYPGGDSLFALGWTRDNAGGKTHPVGQKQPNELGLYDMAGNVWELCRDWWNPGYYKKTPAKAPCNSSKAIFRVTRGGSWRSGPERCYSTARNRNVPDHHKQNMGFRLAE